MGDLKHGFHMVREYAKVITNFKALTNNESFEFAIKFQFRDIDTFIHPDFKNRKDLKYVKRFSETRLARNKFQSLKEAAENEGFKTICTGFDEPSVELIGEMQFDYIKVASCSFTDWPLLKKIVQLNLPVIASTAGSKLEDVDSVVSFFKNRNKELTIMHCVGQYPTKSSDLQLNQIDFLKKRYPEIEVGFSTHEEPDNYESIKIAIGKGASVFEKHVAVVTEKYQKNAYSCTPKQIGRWLLSANSAYEMCGVLGTRYTPSDKEISDLRQFRRGVFAKREINEGDIIDETNIFYAWPSQDDQILANDVSMFIDYVAQKSFKVNEPIYNSNTKKTDTKECLLNIIEDVKSFLNETGIVYPGQAKLEISHHYGIDNFYTTGITIIPVINREYCKKYIIVLRGQSHPEQYHKIKEETFIVLHGSVELYLDGELNLLKKGDVVTIKPNVRHSFKTKDGCVIEEISSTHYVDDSYYTDKTISQNKNRKTLITHWMD